MKHYETWLLHFQIVEEGTPGSHFDPIGKGTAESLVDEVVAYLKERGYYAQGAARPVEAVASPPKALG